MTSKLLTAGSVAPIDEVLTWLIQSTVLLTVGLLAGRFLKGRGPAVQSALYRTILVAVFVCPIASMAIAAMGFPGLVIRVPGAAADDKIEVADRGPDRVGPIARQVSTVIPTSSDRRAIAPSAVESPQASDPMGLPVDVSTTSEPPSILRTGTTPEPVGSVTGLAWIASIILALWLLGTAILAMRLLVDHRRMARLRGTAVPAEPEAQALCHELAGRMCLRLPGVLRSPFLSSPCLDGLRRPAILLPEDAEQNLRDTFVHELAHLGRRDGLWNLLRHLATAALWVQPLLWVLSRRIEETAEEVCDDFVVALGADRGRYASLLLELAERRLPPLAPSGVGMISLRSLLARRIARILDSTRSLSTRAGRRTIAATLLAGLAGTILAGLLGVGRQDHEALGDEPKAGPSRVAGDSASTTAVLPRTSARQTVRGRVVGPDGQPVAGARVTIARYRKAGIGHYGQQGERQELDHTVADAAGRFLLNCESSDLALSQGAESPDRWRDTFIVASAPGFGPAWVWVAQGASEVTEDQPLQLARDDVPITGRIVDLEGRPVAGASLRLIRLQQLGSPESVDHEPKSAAMVQAPAAEAKPRPRDLSAQSVVPGNEPAVSVATTTDADGRFRLTGIGRDRLANLSIFGPTIAFQRVQIVTRLVKPVAGHPPDAPAVDDRTLYGADCTIVAGPGRPIEGVVRDADTKAPIPGAVVTAMQLAGSSQDIEGLISATADSEGRYHLVGLPKANGHRLSVYPPLDRPYFITQFLTVSEGPGLGPVPYDIALKSGIWITGRVTDVQTGQPVQAALHYYPLLANERARDYRNFNANIVSFEWTGNRYRTDTQGRFRVVGLPGRAILAAKTFDRSYRLGIGADVIPEAAGQPAPKQDDLPTYNHIYPRQFQALAEINPPADVREFRRDLVVEPLPSLTVQLVDPEGKPLTQVEAWGRFPDGIDLGDLNLYGQSRTRVVGLEPGKSRTVVFQHPGRKLGAVLVIKSGEAAKGDERTVVLRPCATVTGRVVDADGKPVTGGVQIRLAKGELGGDHDLTLLPVPIGGDGRFRIDDLVPGGNYSLRAADRVALGLSASGKMEPQRFKPFELARNLKLETGQVIDLGTFNAATGQAIKTSEPPAAVKQDQGKVPARDVPITGRIVDLEGRPVRGVTIQVDSTSSAKGGDLNPWLEAVRRGEPSWVAYRHIDNDKEKPSAKAETDSQGRFRIEGLGAEKVVRLSLEGPAIAHTQLEVVTRRIEPLPAQGFSDSWGAGTQTVYGADFTFAAAPGRVVEGVVRDEKTRTVMKDVGVWSFGFAGSHIIGIMTLKTRTDAEGRFHLAGLPKGDGNKLLIVPNDDQPYFMQNVAVPDPPGIGVIPIEINLHKGIWIEGKLTDKETGSPVAGAWFHYLPFLDNKFVEATPELRGGVYRPGAGYQDRYQSKADGSYRLVGLPGRAIVGAVIYKGKPYRSGAGAESIKGMDQHGHFATLNNPVIASRYFPTSMKEINPAAGTETVHLDIVLDPGAKVHLRVVDQQGKPVTGVITGGRRERGVYGREEPEAQAAFDVVTLGPGEDRMVWLVHEGRKLGRVIHVKEGDDKNGPVVVTLEPSATITGRIVDPDGNPVLGATIRPWLKPGGDYALGLPQVAAGGDGRFTVPNVPIGCDYSLVAESRAKMTQRRVAFKDAAVRPGETTDGGDFKLKDN
jgi:beta-lactamase regulating signal transducer with metallopeptidase domain/protocatechuate 3,4-dioxygenase beta subunit